MTTHQSTQLHEAYRHCADITRRTARNFYYGLKLLPEPRRSALYGVYAWMRLVDDIADDDVLPPPAAREQLEHVRQMTHDVFAGSMPETTDDHALWQALAHTARDFDLDIDPFDQMIDGQLEDLEHHGYETFDDLRVYCRRVASTVGLICIDIWGHTNPPVARDLAIKQGIAFQLTNILRDYRTDFENGRVYLPRKDFASAGLTPRQVVAWSDDAACTQFIVKQARRAMECYQASAELASFISPDCRPTLNAMTGIYRGVLDRIIARPGRVVGSEPTRLSTLSKIRIAVRARLSVGTSGPEE